MNLFIDSKNDYIFKRFIPNDFIQNFFNPKAGDKLKVAQIFFPSIKRHILFNYSTRYKLKQIKKPPGKKNIILGTIISGGYFDNNFSEENILNTLKQYDVMAAYHITNLDSGVVYREDRRPIVLKSPLLFITFKLNDNVNIYQEDISSEPLPERNNYENTIKNPFIVANYIFGRYIFLIPDFFKNCTDIEIKYANIIDKKLIPLTSKSYEKKEDNKTSITYQEFEDFFKEIIAKEITKF